MDIPIVLLVLLALPIALSALIITVSAGRRRRRSAHGPDSGGVVHRLQADTAVDQDAAVPAPVEPRAEVPGRERRAAAAAPPPDDDRPLPG